MSANRRVHSFDSRTILATFLYGTTLGIILWRDPLGIASEPYYSSKTGALVAMTKTISLDTALCIIIVFLEILLIQLVITITNFGYPRLANRLSLQAVFQELFYIFDAAMVFLRSFDGYDSDSSGSDEPAVPAKAAAMILMDSASISVASPSPQALHKRGSLTPSWVTDSSTPSSPRLSTAPITPPSSPPIESAPTSASLLALDFSLEKQMTMVDVVSNRRSAPEIFPDAGPNSPPRPEENVSILVSRTSRVESSLSASADGTGTLATRRRRRATFFIGDDVSPPQSPPQSSGLTRSRSLCTLAPTPSPPSRQVQSNPTTPHAIEVVKLPPTRAQSIKPFKGAVVRSPSSTPSNPWAKDEKPPAKLSYKARFRAKERDRRRLAMTPIKTMADLPQDAVGTEPMSMSDPGSASSSDSASSPLLPTHPVEVPQRQYETTPSSIVSSAPALASAGAKVPARKDTTLVESIEVKKPEPAVIPKVELPHINPPQIPLHTTSASCSSHPALDCASASSSFGRFHDRWGSKVELIRS